MESRACSQFLTDCKDLALVLVLLLDLVLTLDLVGSALWDLISPVKTSRQFSHSGEVSEGVWPK